MSNSARRMVGGMVTAAALTAATFVSQTQTAAQVVFSTPGSIQSETQQDGEPTVGGTIVMSAGAQIGADGPVFGSVEIFSSDGNQMIMPMRSPMVDTNNWSSLLNLPEVREELEIVDDQFEEISAARNRLEKDLKSRINEMITSGFDPSKAKDLGETIKEQRAAIDSELQQMLLPSQVERLKQLALHIRMKQAGAVGVLSSKEVMEELEMNEEQLEALKKKAEELKKELDEKYEVMKKKAQEELLDELKPNQRKKLEALMGANFDYKTPAMTDRPKRMSRSTLKDNSDK